MRKLLFSRQSRHFVEYVNFDWESNVVWKNFYAKNKEVLGKDRDLEHAKRLWYKQNVNRHFDAEFCIENTQERLYFLDQCNFLNSLTSLTLMARH